MEISVPYSFVWRLYDVIVKVINLSAFNRSTEQYSEYMRKSLCNFQLRYTNYQFNSSQLHKKFKESFNKNDLESSENHFNEMKDFIEKSMSIFCGELVADIKNYFCLTHRSKDEPRVSVYLVDEENNKLVNIVVLPRLDANIEPKEIKKNTCFSDICICGQAAYLANNIPKIAKSDDHFLDEELNIKNIKSNYELRMFFDNKFVARIFNNFIKKSWSDKEWIKTMKMKNDHHQFIFKSRLVIPITYRRHAELKMLNDKMVRMLKLSKEGRSILGFICIDHPSTYYFDDALYDSYENIDINAMYVFADMLSLVLITWLMYTTGSSTFCDYSNMHHGRNE